MPRKKQNPNENEGAANSETGHNGHNDFPERTNGSSGFEAETTTATADPITRRGRRTHTATARSPRSRKADTAQAEVTVTVEATPDPAQAVETHTHPPAGTQVREGSQGSQDNTRQLQDVRQEVAQLDEQVRSLRRNTVEAGK